jgi:DNA-binding NtrC family response regulator
LREREDDIPTLVENFVHKFARRQGKSIERIPDDVMEALKHHDWPGNIRELQNVIERAVIMTTGPVLELQTRGLIMQHYSSVPTRTLQDAERAHITKTLHETNWVVGGRDGAAAKLGLARTTLIAMMQRLGIRREKFGHGAEQPNQLFVTTPRGYLHASHDTPRETAFKINSRLNNDTAA